MTAIPTYDQFIFPLLKVLRAHPEGIRARSAHDEVADAVGLSDEARAEMLPSGLALVYRNRIAWAHDRLKRQRLSEAPKRGTWSLTEEGAAFIESHQDGIDDETLRSITRVPRGSRASGKPDEDAADDVAVTTRSPEERIDDAISELNDSLSEELLTTILDSPPEFFERLVLDVLHAMGYGVSRADLEPTGGSGDGGIDGIITLDKLGLEKVYVQAKRWSSGTVSRPDIQGFFGALAGKRATKGVFITTSAFSSKAQDYAGQVSDSLVLVDGQQLAELMIEYGVGVTIQRTARIGRVDSDYFEV